MRSPRTSIESLNSPLQNSRNMQYTTPHKSESRSAAQLAQLPTPPASFEENTTPDSSQTSTERGNTSTRLWTATSPGVEDTRMSPNPYRMAPPSETLGRRMRWSLSPEPDVPRTISTGSSRATPDMEGRKTRESSPAVPIGRSPSPDPCDGDRSRSNSPEATMRPPPLSPLSAQKMNAKNHQRRESVGARSVTMSTTYDMMTTYVGSDGQPKRQQVQGQVTGRVLAPPFQPNSGLSKRITPSFIANYTSPGAVPAKRSRETMSPEYDEYEPQDEPEAASRALSGSLGRSLLASQDIYAGSDGTATSQSGDFLRESKLKTGRNAVMDSAIDWDSSVPNLPPPENRLRSSASPTASLISSDSAPEESLSTVYYKEFSSQLDTFARSLKKPLVTFVLIMIIPIFLGISTSILGGRPPQLSNSTNSTFGGNIDFPTLMSIEASFERVVDSAAGGSELARSLKRSEMAVADLSMVVRYSDLNCRDTLSTRLQQFADDAHENVLGLLEFSAMVGGVLDELLAVNQWALRQLNEINTLQISAPSAGRYGWKRLYNALPWPLSVLWPSNQAIAKQRLSHTFEHAVEALETNLRLLIAHGTIIQTGLMGLSQQNGPIRTEIVREFADIRRAEGEAMSSLWTRIQTTAGKRQNFKDNERLLREINVYHDKARGYVEVTLLELGRMTSELDNLRRRVAQPLLVERRYGVEVGMEDQVGAIQNSVEALLRKQNERDERQRIWNRIILEGTMKEPQAGSVEGPRF
ncbi:Similar to hypothetical protein [Tuber melanosporum Mel28]; acc. no. XP_002841587 [Pyronema omphalodes CBS 100304]|uniref:Uncharacterized protein n=1 Tax=Pyronema omphalodes (strain CBS 100304) TaxID=1076935 RepID=U4LD38_PYROM|nr:Similar to hypothetical protein [Tuber melanosporum Mel28]; acc. no. XP_002841587 [Pyronema omphalodes CBS 100304]